MGSMLRGVLLLLHVLGALGSVPLPTTVVPLLSVSGEKMLLESSYKNDFLILSQHFVTQQTATYCGVASSVMVLNALESPRPLLNNSGPFSNPQYAYYTQDNVFDNNTEPVLSKAAVDARGMSLEELSKFLGAHTGVSSSYVHSGLSGSSVDTFRQLVLQALATPHMFVIVNFDRAQLQEAGAGHHSPIAAYHAASDSVLVLDVSRYKYPAWWATIPQLYASSYLSNDESTNRTRGLAFAWVTGNASPVLDGSASLPDTDNGNPQHAAGLPNYRPHTSVYVMAMLMASMTMVGCVSGAAVVTWLYRSAGGQAFRRSVTRALQGTYPTSPDSARGRAWAGVVSAAAAAAAADRVRGGAVAEEERFLKPGEDASCRV